MELKRTRLVRLLSLLLLLTVLAWNLPSEALARAGRGVSGGSSMGSRGSRSTSPVTPYTPPSKPSTPSSPYSPGYQPTTPTRPVTPPPVASPSPTGGFWRNVGGGLLGGFAGGMMANWLFGGSSPAQGGAPGTGGGSSFGMFDLILLAGIGYLLYRFLVKKPQEEAAGGPGTYQSSATGGALQPPYYEQEAPLLGGPEKDLEKGLAQIKAMDPLFGEDKFKDQAMDYFFKIQGAWGDRDLSTVKHLLTGEMFNLLQEDADKMRQDGHINKIENIAVREVNPTEAWQEAGQDYITLRIYATLLDYTLDEKTGQITEGSKTEPVKFEEYWTFTRPLGNNPWQLSAISQVK
jgi:predicted lipid-binding transport protein (Tim44 family)